MHVYGLSAVEKNLAALSEEIPHGVLKEKKFQTTIIKGFRFQIFCFSSLTPDT